MQPSIGCRSFLHCSSSNFLETAKREMPGELVLCTTGSKFTFTA